MVDARLSLTIDPAKIAGVVEHIAGLEAELAAAKLALAQIRAYREHLIDEIHNGHGANRAGYERVVERLAAILDAAEGAR